MRASRSDRITRFLAVVGIAGSLAAAGFPAVAEAKVLYARDEALQLALPEAEKVEPRDIVLTDEQHDRIQKMARAALDSKLVTLYVGWKDGTPVGYAIFDTNTVRTYPETFVVVIGTDGAVRSAHLVAFHEPEEYMPTPRWMGTFAGRRLSDDLEVGRAVAAITGSTLSTRAVTAGIRRALAIWEVAIGGR